MSDITGAGKIAEAAERFTREIRELVRDLFQPAARELGEHLADRVRLYREEAALRALLLARDQIEASGLPRVPLTVKDSVLLLEGASLEEDDYLTSRWAGLIASAATGGQTLPAFADILRQLSPEEARMLDFIYEEAREHPVLAGAHCVTKASIRLASGLGGQDFIIRIQNLHRLELVVQITTMMEQQPVRGAGGWSGDGEVGLTTLGEAFVGACRGPIRPSP